MKNYKEIPILSVNDLTVTYNKYGSAIKALDGLTLPDIYSGSLVFLTGHNGSGKSTLFKVVSKQLKLNAGTVNIKGVSINNLTYSNLSSQLFLVNQNPSSSTIDELTVWENLVFAVENYSKSNLEDALNQSGLFNHKKHLVKNLSGGQRQLLSLEIARLKKVSILLLDEPFAALDKVNTENAMKLILKLHAEGMTVLFITHDRQIIQHPVVPSTRIVLEIKSGKLNNQL